MTCFHGRRMLWCCSLVLFLFNSPAFCDKLVITSDMLMDYAVKTFEEKDYSTALVEFKRFLHFFPDDPEAERARFQTGLCLFHLKRYKEAAKIFNDIILDDSKVSFKAESFFLQSRAFKEMGNLGYAKLVLFNYLKLSRDVDEKDRIYSALADLFIASYSDNDRKPLADARKALEKISSKNAGIYQKQRRMGVLDDALNTPLKNPAAAGIFSIIPGGGFFYCERYQDAFVAFLLNSALIFAAYEAFDQGNEALGAVISFVEAGFYTGNIYGSISAAHQYNRIATLKILNKNLDLHSHMDLGNKGIGLYFTYRF